jgi:hypothetical protein
MKIKTKNIMKQKISGTKKEKIYPLFYKGKWYNKKDVDDLFRCFYHTRYALGFNCSVYVSEGMRICPDGTIDA